MMSLKNGISMKINDKTQPLAICADVLNELNVIISYKTAQEIIKYSLVGKLHYHTWDDCRIQSDDNHIVIEDCLQYKYPLCYECGSNSPDNTTCKCRYCRDIFTQLDRFFWSSNAHVLRRTMNTNNLENTNPIHIRDFVARKYNTIITLDSACYIAQQAKDDRLWIHDECIHTGSGENSLHIARHLSDSLYSMCYYCKSDDPNETCIICKHTREHSTLDTFMQVETTIAREDYQALYGWTNHETDRANQLLEKSQLKQLYDLQIEPQYFNPDTPDGNTEQAIQELGAIIEEDMRSIEADFSHYIEEFLGKVDFLQLAENIAL